MIYAIHPKLPMRDINKTLGFYQKLGFQNIGVENYKTYLLMKLDIVEIHFFAYPELEVSQNYGQVYIRTDAIHELYRQWVDQGVEIHPNGPLEQKPWKQWEFSLLDPDFNLLTFGQSV